MKFSCTQENLKQGLFNVAHVAGKNINLPILSNVLFDVSGNNVKLVTTDLEIGVTCNVRGKIEKSGKFTVKAKLLTDYIGLLPNKRVDVELLDNELCVKCENYKTKIKGEEAGDYPIIPSIDRAEFYSFDFASFRNVMAGVIFATAMDETRIELSGVYFEFNSKELVLAATDSYRLAERKMTYKNKSSNTNETKKLIIPNKTLQEVLRMSSNLKETDISTDKPNHEIKIYISDNQILFIYDEVELVSRIIEGQYPDYKQIIPNVSQENKTTVAIDRQEFSQAIKASSLFSKTNINDVHLDFPEAQKKVVVSSVSGQSGESTVEVPAEIKGKDSGIVLNYKYLLDGLNSLGDERVVMEIVDSNTPFVLKAEDQKDYLYIIMPIKQ